MTVSVKLADGGVDDYFRFGDSYIKHRNGSLDVVRTGSKEPHSYASGVWTDVEGDEHKGRKRRLFG